MSGLRQPGSARHLWTALLLLAALLLPGHAGARWVDLGGGGLEVRLLDSDGARSVIEISLGGFEATPVAIDGETYYRITLEGATVQEEPGFPALPDVRRSVIIPDEQDVAVRLLAAEHVDVPATPVAPSKGHLPRSIDPATVPYVFDAFYGTGGVYPPALVSAEDPYILRDLRGAVIDANVFQYLPASRTLRVYTRLLLEVAPSGPATINPLQRAEPLGRMDPQFAALYGRHFLNFGGGTRYTPVLEEGGLLIITYDSFRPAVEPLHRWKLQKGMPSKLVDLSTVGSTSAQIKAYIENEYHTSGIAYVLLVGDAAQVPTIAYRNGSDPSYSLITPDNYPDLFVGRFSAETLAQAATQVERTIAYERDAAAGESWPQWGMGIASSGGADRGHYGESDILHGELIRADLLAYGYTAVDRLYAPEAMAVQVTSALNAGRGIVNYTGHGSETAWSTTGFSNSHVAALTNDNMLPFICSVACMNGNFTNGNCFAEAWLRSTHDGQPVGAVAAYMSTINQSWAPPMDAQDEVVDLLVADRMRTIGGLFFNGSCLMIERNDTTGVKEFKCWTIFGDPSLIVRTREVEPMSAAHTGVLRLGQDSFALIVPGVPGALCALYADGVLYGSAFTDPSGAATITIAQPPLEPMTLLLTVTAFNRETLVEDIAVVPVSGAHLTIRAVEYLDGSGDGILNAGETVQMRLQLENVGDSTATGVSALIGSASGELTILAGSRTFPDIAPADTAWSDSAFVLAIASNCPDQRVVTIPLSFSGGERSLGQGLVGFAVQAPDIVIAEVQVDDTLGGNGNMRLDPGETAAIRISLANRGHYPLTDLAGLLTCDDSQVQVLEGSGSHPGLARGASGVLSPDFVVAVDAGFALTDAICR
ncbi:MAG: hypothetical protein FJY75_12105, partial [Candidatus Eisenbacteria bacterium]|nr:hypothetical protein [Candidatus Eisenbacteria bacterium]